MGEGAEPRRATSTYPEPGLVEVRLVVPGDDLLDEVAGGGEVATLAEEQRGPVPEPAAAAAAPAPGGAGTGARARGALAGIEDGVEVAVDPVVVAVHRRRNRGEWGRRAAGAGGRGGEGSGGGGDEGGDEKERETERETEMERKWAMEYWNWNWNWNWKRVVVIALPPTAPRGRERGDPGRWVQIQRRTPGRIRISVAAFFCHRAVWRNFFMTVKFYSRIRICQNQEKFVQNCHALAGVVRNLCDANKGANGYPLGALQLSLV